MLLITRTIAPGACFMLFAATSAYAQAPVTEQQAIELVDTLLDRLDRQKAAESRLSDLDKRLKNYQFETIDAETAVEQARLNLQAYTQLEQSERKSLNSQIELAKATLEMARNRVDWSQRMLKQQYIAPAEALYDQAVLQQAEIDLMKARENLKIYDESTRPKAIKKLEKDVADAEKAAVNQITQRPILQRERDDLARRLDADKLLDEDRKALDALLQGLEALDASPSQPDLAARQFAEARRLVSLSESRRAPRRRADRVERIRQMLTPPPETSSAP